VGYFWPGQLPETVKRVTTGTGWEQASSEGKAASEQSLLQLARAAMVPPASHSPLN